MDKLNPTIKPDDVSSLLFLTELPTYQKSSRFIGKRYPQDFVNLLYVTSFLAPNVTPAQRLWHILNNMLSVPKCECGVLVKWNRINKNYSLWCSATCKNKSNIHKTKVKNTCQQKYGTSSYTASADFRQKYVTTMQNKYGADHYLKNATKRQEIQKLLKEKYNYKTPFSLPEIQRRCKEVFKITYGCHPTQSRFSKHTLKLLKDRDWLYDQHVNQRKTLKEICGLLENYDISSISDIFKSLEIPIHNFSVSLGEKQLQDFVNSCISAEFNRRDIIGPYELDIFIPSKNIAIEYCGIYWHNELNKPANYHQIKFNRCKQQGIRLITIFEDEWLQNRSIIENKLQHILGISTSIKVFARKCEIAFVNTAEKEAFFEAHHIQGNGPSSINLGLYYDHVLVACMGFTTGINNSFNLTRYATSKHVIGGFTKLLSRFEKTFEPTKIHTFADLRWSNGDIYRQNGFELVGTLLPDYSYVINDRRIHKFNFRHRRLVRILEKYDSTASEHQNCLRHGIYRIYDCGKLKFTKIVIS